MDARLLVSSKYMVSESFGLGDVPKEPTVTIASVSLADEEGDRGKERWGLLHFKEPWAKPLKINRTHQRALLLMFNPEGDYDTGRWVGKRIGLRAVWGVYFGKRQTAVRIAGSPDISKPLSFNVKKFGGGKDTYTLVPLGVQLGPGYVRFGKEKGVYGRLISELADDVLEQLVKSADAQLADPKNSKAKWSTDVAANVKEIRAHLEERAKARQPPPAEQETQPEEGAPF